MINILDLGYGNAFSVANTLEVLEYPFHLVSHPSKLQNGVLIIPGVGSIASLADGLRKSNWSSCIEKYASNGNNIIGICLGLHALTSFSEESGGMKCMNLLPGNASTLILDPLSQRSNTGWHPFTIDKNYLIQNLWVPFFARSRKKSIKGRAFYNHIYGAKINSKHSLQIPDYESFASIVVKKNIMGIQFHPEKSQTLGKELFEFIL
jgi:glutamine amidotransferase